MWRWAGVLLVLGVASMARAAEDPQQGGDSSVEAQLARVAKMTRAQQQAWLAELEQRAVDAARRTLKPEDARREADRVAALLHRKMVSWQVLRELLTQTLDRERAMAKSTDAPATPRPTVVQKPVMAPRVEINADELAARIAGSNLGLRTLEADLDSGGAWSAARLEPIVDRLEILVLRYHDLGLFYDLLSKAQQAAIAPLDSPQLAIAEVASRIAEARRRASGKTFRGTAVERPNELERLGRLSRRLAKLESR